MTAPTLIAVTDAIAEQLRTIPDVYVHGMWEGDTQYPALIVMPVSVPAYHETFSPVSSAVRNLEIEVWALAAPAETGQLLYAQRTMCELADWTGTKSVPAAIRADATLGSVVSQCIVSSFETFGSEDVAGIGYWGGRFRLTIQSVR